MWISINDERCMGHGRCYAVARELLSADDEGFVAERGSCWEVPPELLGQAEEAEGACPEGAISVTATDPTNA